MTYIEQRELWVKGRRAELSARCPLIIGKDTDEDIKDAFMLHVPVNWPDGSPLQGIRLGENGTVYTHSTKRVNGGT